MGDLVCRRDPVQGAGHGQVLFLVAEGERGCNRKRFERMWGQLRVQRAPSYVIRRGAGTPSLTLSTSPTPDAATVERSNVANEPEPRTC
jgi:hypothetical protein